MKLNVRSATISVNYVIGLKNVCSVQLEIEVLPYVIAIKVFLNFMIFRRNSLYVKVAPLDVQLVLTTVIVYNVKVNLEIA